MSEPYPKDTPIPRGEQIVIVQDTAEQRSASGLYIPAEAQHAKNTGVVVAVGRDLKYKPVLKAGDRVVFNLYAGQEVEYLNRKFKIIKEADVLCILP